MKKAQEKALIFRTNYFNKVEINLIESSFNSLTKSLAIFERGLLSILSNTA